MFNKHQILRFCNREMVYYRKQYQSSEGIIDFNKLADEFIYQHAMEDLNIKDKVLQAVELWWKESKFNQYYNPLKF